MLQAASEMLPEEGKAPVSQARLDANRANARKSTGPRTPEGKARVARNAITHGLLCRQAVMQTDDRREFEAFRTALWMDLKPAGAMEEMLAERIIAGHWRLRRAIHLDTCLMERDLLRSLRQEEKHDIRDFRPPGETVHPVAVGEALQQSMCAAGTFETLRRYERTIQRDLGECLRQLQGLQANRRGRLDLAGPSQAPVLGEEQGEEGMSNRESPLTSDGAGPGPEAGTDAPAHPAGQAGGFVSQEGPGREEPDDGFVSQGLRGHHTQLPQLSMVSPDNHGFVSQEEQAVEAECELVGSVSHAAGK